jgi:hypothetical protein
LLLNLAKATLPQESSNIGERSTSAAAIAIVLQGATETDERVLLLLDTAERTAL